MSEDKSADSAGIAGAPVTQSLGEAPETTPLPRQTLGEVAAAAPEPVAAPAVQSLETVSAPERVEQAVGPAPSAPNTPAEPVQVIGAAPPKRRRGVLGGVIFAVIFVVLVAAIGFLAYDRFTGDPTKNAQAGQCLGGLPAIAPGEDQEAKSGKVVDCGDSSAVYKIESRLDSQSEDQAKSIDVCKGSPAATVVYRAIPSSGTGYVLCLSKLG